MKNCDEQPITTMTHSSGRRNDKAKHKNAAENDFFFLASVSFSKKKTIFPTPDENFDLRPNPRRDVTARDD